jgi:hypothetical protein
MIDRFADVEPLKSTLTQTSADELLSVFGQRNPRREVHLLLNLHRGRDTIFERSLT